MSVMQQPAQASLDLIASHRPGLALNKCAAANTHSNPLAARTCLHSLSARGLIERIDGGDGKFVWAATRKGQMATTFFTGSMKDPEAPTRAAPRTVYGKGTYTPTTINTRPGSDAAFKLPSRIGSRLTYRAAN